MRHALWRRMFPAMAALAMTWAPRPAGAQSLTLSGGADARAVHESPPGDTRAELTGLFLNLRKIWSDDAGDRWIAVAQADLDHNFEDLSPYQVYLQYKGPLGKWNLRAGHFLLPFGLLATYDTERLVLNGLEEASLGLRKDTGAQVLGRFGHWDYALAVSMGVGDERLLPLERSRLLTGRVAYVTDTGQIGVSLLAGRLLPDAQNDADAVRDEWRIGTDVTTSLGRFTLRAEALAGGTAGRPAGGGIVLADYALGSRLELNTRAAYWSEESSPYSVGAGFTYRPWNRLQLRIADSRTFGEGNRNALTAQIYYDFSRIF